MEARGSHRRALCFYQIDASNRRDSRFLSQRIWLAALFGRRTSLHCHVFPMCGSEPKIAVQRAGKGDEREGAG